MTLSEELLWRGQIKDHTFDNLKWLDTPRTYYLGADCSSADSLTIGNLAIYMLARRLQKAGWKPVMLVGGATSLIGDPGGKDEERSLVPRSVIQANVRGIAKQVSRLLNGGKITLVDNYDWFKDIGYLDFLREVGKNYSMTELLQRQYISDRLGEGGSGISYAEFSYSLIQGYDYWHLSNKFGVELQIGGSDQWGNMLSGVPLIRKKEAREVHALSIPLVIDKSTGKKFGKSEAGAIWLDPAKTTPTQFYQFWINIDDELLEGHIKTYTDLDKTEIESIISKHTADPAKRFAQRRLAEEVTTLVHGESSMKIARSVTDFLTGATSIDQADAKSLKALRQEIPFVGSTDTGSIVDALVKANLAESNSDARRLIKSSAISLNGQKISRDNFEPADFTKGRLLIRKGKKFSDSALVEI